MMMTFQRPLTPSCSHLIRKAVRKQKHLLLEEQTTGMLLVTLVTKHRKQFREDRDCSKRQHLVLGRKVDVQHQHRPRLPIYRPSNRVIATRHKDIWDESLQRLTDKETEKEEEQKRREEYLRENGFVSEEIDDEDIRQFKYRAIQRQIAEKEERRKIQKQQRAEEEKRLEEEKKRKEEMKLERYFERLRLKRENEKQQLKQQREEEERREKAQGILDEIETIAEMRKRETRADKKDDAAKEIIRRKRQRLSVIDEIDESNRERETHQTAAEVNCRVILLTICYRGRYL
ncbi:hypothetical protein BSL78_10567 [Apostichopus japonicus]|uniref:Uncharacterized protein n=1 Tax=Stichopus japonicus TaxID=307972 RepID=A0A2G8KWZ4_STIJA|nr:hypothetical protein BSL78_10567 [Apostichopus japonicus]